MTWRNFLPAVFSSGYLIFLELANHYVGEMLWWEMAALLLSVGYFWFLRREVKKGDSKQDLAGFSFFLFLVGSFVFLIFVDRPFFRQLTILTSAALLYLYFHFLILSLGRKTELEIKKFFLIREALTVSAFFLFFSFFFGWLTFLGKAFWLVVLISMVTTAILSKDFFYSLKMKEKISIPILVNSLLLGEFFWALYLLPVGFLVKGLLSVILWSWLSQAIAGYSVEGKLTKKFGFLSVFFFLLIILILSTTRWI